MLLVDLQRADADRAKLLGEFLSAVLSCSPASIISDGLASRLRARGLNDQLAGRAAELVEGMVASRYGGRGGGELEDDAESVVGEIEEALGRPR